MYNSNPFRISVFLVAALFTVNVEAQGPYGQVPYQPTQIDRYVGEAVPDIWDESQPLERFFAAVAKRSRVTLEYLHWDLENPEARSLGAPITDIADPSQPFQVFNNINGSGANAGFGVVVNTNVLGLEDSPGVRGTLAVDLNGGTLETTFFGLSQNNDNFRISSIPTNTIGSVPPNTLSPFGRVTGSLGIGTQISPNIVTPLRTNGSATSSAALNAIIYDESYAAAIETQLWGSEVMFLQDYYLPNEPFNWQWLGGFRYVSLQEDVVQVGSFNDGGVLVTSEVTTSGGNAYNNMYGPEIGGRASLRSKFVTFTATPRIAFALNDHTSTVYGSIAGGANPGNVRVTEESIDFTPIVELNLKLQFHLTPHFTVFGGYDLFYAGMVSRPADNIVYDSTPNGAGFDPTVRQNVRLEDFLGKGLSIGGILTY